MKMRIGDMTIDQLIEFCNKRYKKNVCSACKECPFLNHAGDCMWDGLLEGIVDGEVDVGDVSLAPVDIYNKFREEFPEMLSGMIGWEYDRDMIGNNRIIIRIRRDPLSQERWLYDYEDNDVIRVE